MNIKKLKIKKINDEDWSGRFVDETDYDVLHQKSCILVEDPKEPPVAVFLKGVIPTRLNELALMGFKAMGAFGTNNRGTASGIKAEYKIKENGMRSNTTRVRNSWAVQSGVLGYFERDPRRPYCHACAWNMKHPDKFHQFFVPVTNHVEGLFKEHCRQAWEYQRSFADRTNKAWLIGDTCFTSITVNKNFRTACHLDAGDLTNGRSCMTVMEQGEYGGANLVLPNYRVAFDIRMGDMIIFDPHQFHGNTQIVKKTPAAARYSIVYYYRELVQYCQSPSAELDFAKNRKQGTTLFPERK